MLQRLRPKQRDSNANSGAIWQSLGTCRCDCMEFHGRAICYLATIANYLSLLCGSTVGYPSDSLASCHLRPVVIVNQISLVCCCSVELF